MSIIEINAADANKLIQEQNALLIDIRSVNEYNKAHAQDAINIPTDEIGQNSEKLKSNSIVIFMCLSGIRTKINAKTLASNHQNDIYILSGGLKAWQKAGFAIIKNQNIQIISLERQIQIIAGSLVLIGCLIGYFINISAIFLSAFVGIGLIFAGISGFCGMAILLQKMPWNRNSIIKKEK